MSGIAFGSSSSTSSGIETINDISPDGLGNFTIQAGTGITVTSITNGVEISSSSSGFTWNDESSDFTASADNGYFINASLTATLPASISNGDSIKFIMTGNYTFILQSASGQIIQIGLNQSSVAGTARTTVTGTSLTVVGNSSLNIWFSDSGPEANWELL